MSQLDLLYEMAIRGGRQTERAFMFKGSRISGKSKSGGVVSVWFSNSDERREKEFYIQSFESVTEFKQGIGEWVQSRTETVE
jgi:hypothetical protein